MTSMGYTTQTVSDLMSLVDDHKDELTEQTYVQICNAMKVLHQQSKKPEPLPQPRRITATVQQHSLNSEIAVIEYRIQGLIEEISILENSIRNFRPIRITNTDKNIVLQEFGYTGPIRTQQISAFLKHLIENNVLTTKRYKELLECRKTIRSNQQIMALRTNLNNLQDQRITARQHLNQLHSRQFQEIPPQLERTDTRT